MEEMQPDLMTLEQLVTLGYDGTDTAKRHSRPLLICDVDEVVLDLVDPFVEVIQERGFILKSHSFKLTGNVFHSETGREATQEEVWAGLTQLFEEQAIRQGIVDGVVEGLKNMAAEVDIVFLTNMPHPFRDTRREHLKSHGIEYPLLTNTRSKLPAIRILSEHCDSTVGFIDDTPKNLQQIRDGAPHVHLFHFMANENFRNIAEKVEGTHFSTGDWHYAQSEIRRVLLENK